MRSLRSSSVLAANVFDYWRDRDLEPLAAALGLDGSFERLEFEHPFAHGLSSGKPHLDVVLFPFPPNRLWGVEAKFAEPYDIRGKGNSVPLDAKYLSSQRRRWAELGLPQCQALAERLGKEEGFHHLGAGQLLKRHSLTHR
jgi:hypothetical protein